MIALASADIKRRLLAESTHRARQARLRLWLLRVLLVVVVLAGWELASGRLIDVFWLSKPSLITSALLKQIRSGDLLFHVSFTLQEMALGLLFGGSAGALAGILLGRQRFLAELLTPVIIAIYSLPKVALAPLFILWFGIDLTSKVVLVSVIVFFLVFFNTFSGVREVKAELINVLKLAGANDREVFWHVILPSANIWVIAGLRLAVPYSLIGAVVAELMAASRGVGYQLQFAAQMFDTSGLFASLVVLMAIALVLNMVLTRIERRLLHWKSVGDRLDVMPT
jgi:NitT/TauT family transport system permease protein